MSLHFSNYIQSFINFGYYTGPRTFNVTDDTEKFFPMMSTVWEQYIGYLIQDASVHSIPIKGYRLHEDAIAIHNIAKRQVLLLTNLQMKNESGDLQFPIIQCRILENIDLVLLYDRCEDINIQSYADKNVLCCYRKICDYNARNISGEMGYTARQNRNISTGHILEPRFISNRINYPNQSMTKIIICTNANSIDEYQSSGTTPTYHDSKRRLDDNLDATDSTKRHRGQFGNEPMHEGSKCIICSSYFQSHHTDNHW
jgi:hypothetical protein